MATSIASQLQAIKSIVQADLEPLKRPFTRPSILFDPKEAADIDIDAIFNIALNGLEALVNIDERFRNYKNNLFSHKSREMDRELMKEDENKLINISISSYLRLLSGHIQLQASLKTLEYLIRRYKIHVYNVEDLIVCVLPYHDTHAFVRIVQLLIIGNTKWKFLDGVNFSGAPPPRNVIVQQCIRDESILEVLCNYASSSKGVYPSRPAISFCTAVVVEALGSLTTIEPNVVSKVLPFVQAGLQPGAKGDSSHKASALMIVALLANKVTLIPKLVNSLVRSISEIARDDAKALKDLQSCRLSIMALIALVQLQSIDVFPKKALDFLKEIRDFTGYLCELSKEFNTDKFLSVLLDSLVDYSSSDELCLHTLISIIETVPVKSLVLKVVSKILLTCAKLSHKLTIPGSSNSGSWAKKVLIVVSKKYTSELHGAIQKFYEQTEVQCKKGESLYETLCTILDENSDLTFPISDSKLLFALHHPKAEVRRSALSSLSMTGFSRPKAVDSEMNLINIQDAIWQQLHDDDLTVVKMALSVDGLQEILISSDHLKGLQNVLKRCVGLLMSTTSVDRNLASEVAILCVEKVNACVQDNINELKILAALLFPLLLILPKTQVVNLKALQLAKEIQWPLYQNLPTVISLKPVAMDLILVFWSPLNAKDTRDFAFRKFPPIREYFQALQPGDMSSINLETVSSLAEAFLMHPEDYKSWLSENGKNYELSKVLFLLVLMQACVITKNRSVQFLEVFNAIFPVLKAEWKLVESTSDTSVEMLKAELLNWDCRRFLDQLFKDSHSQLCASTFVCIFWRLLEAFTSALTTDISSDSEEKWVCVYHDLFIFFATSGFGNFFKEHLHYLVKNFKIFPVRSLCRFFTEEGIPIPAQLQSLQCFAFLCSQSENQPLAIDLLAAFPSILVPLVGDDQDIRIAAMNCVEGLYALLNYADFSSKKNGKNASWSCFLDKLLVLMVEQKRLILSDGKYFPSLLVCLLSSPSHNLLVPQSFEQRFDEPTKDIVLAFILGAALELSNYAKLMILSLLKGMGNVILRFKGAETLLSLLLARRERYYFEHDKSFSKLTSIEVSILCLLLECCVTPPEGNVFEDHLLKALQDVKSEEHAVKSPCITVLQKLDGQVYSGLQNETQVTVFCKLVLLFRNDDGDIQNATRDSLRRINIPHSIVHQMFDCILKDGSFLIFPVDRKKKKRLRGDHKSNLSQLLYDRQNALPFLSSLLDILLLKKDMSNRESLLGPLFKLLEFSFSKDIVNTSLALNENSMNASSGVSKDLSCTLCDFQQTILIIMEDICASFVASISPKGDLVNVIDIKLLVECSRISKDSGIRNHVFFLITYSAKIVPKKVTEHIQEIFTLLGESAVTQIDSHSQHVFEGLISALVPCWLSEKQNMENLLKIFVNVLPEVAEHRRLSIVLYLLRVLGEFNGLSSLIVLLFQSQVSKLSVSKDLDSLDYFISFTPKEWEYQFALQICGQFSCLTWLPALVSVIKHIVAKDESLTMFIELLPATKLILEKLEDPNFTFELGIQENQNNIQKIIGQLMELIISVLQLIDSRSKKIGVPVPIRKKLSECVHDVLKTISKVMIPSAYFQTITNLLARVDKNVGKKALEILCESLRVQGRIKSMKNKRREGVLKSCLLQITEGSFESFNEMCLGIVNLIESSKDESSTSLKLAAVSTVELLVDRFPSNHSTYGMFLKSIVKCISSNNLVVSSSSLRTSAAILNALGPRALPELPHLMANVIKLSHDVSSQLDTKGRIGGDLPVQSSGSKESVILSILIFLEAVIDKLGSFLNPYLGDIVELLVLHPDFVSGSNLKLKQKADLVRRLLMEKIPVRLALPPLLKMYQSAMASGDSSLVITFDMLSNLVSTMDRSSVGAHHTKLYDLFLLALDLRCRPSVSVQDIYAVESSVIGALVSLTMKLTESMFRPLFIRSIEWAESVVEDVTSSSRPSVNRAISFYSLVNKLAEKHRSLFVPYFKYILENCVRHLTDNGDQESTIVVRKKKKAKLQVGLMGEERSILSSRNWHLRALILSSLHKCFLYDTGNLKFLDNSNFQVLVKPIVSQLAIEPPVSLEKHKDVPSVNDVDDLLVNCVGQMAVAAGSDLLWKPLNHEVLMQTRSEKVRSRILGLKIVKYFVENLKEEYLVLIAETIPFLGELLEDVEPSVKSFAQEILKEMEIMSGESLRQYL